MINLLIRIETCSCGKEGLVNSSFLQAGHSLLHPVQLKSINDPYPFVCCNVCLYVNIQPGVHLVHSRSIS